MCLASFKKRDNHNYIIFIIQIIQLINKKTSDTDQPHLATVVNNQVSYNQPSPLRRRKNKFDQYLPTLSSMRLPRLRKK